MSTLLAIISLCYWFIHSGFWLLFDNITLECSSFVSHLKTFYFNNFFQQSVWKTVKHVVEHLISAQKKSLIKMCKKTTRQTCSYHKNIKCNSSATHIINSKWALMMVKMNSRSMSMMCKMMKVCRRFSSSYTATYLSMKPPFWPLLMDLNKHPAGSSNLLSKACRNNSWSAWMSCMLGFLAAEIASLDDW